MEKTKLKHKILDTLLKYPETRNSDQLLTITLWQEYYPSIFTEINGEKFIRVNSIIELPREDHIKRIRAVIQNEEHLFLPTSLEVAVQRGLNEEKWKEWITYETSYLRK